MTENHKTHLFFLLRETTKKKNGTASSSFAYMHIYICMYVCIGVLIYAIQEPNIHVQEQQQKKYN